IRVLPDPVGDLLRDGDADGAGVVENDGVAVDDLEGLDGVAADVAFDGVLADAVEMGLGPDSVTGRAAGRDIGVAKAEALGRGVVAGCGGGGSDGDVADADG